MRETPRRSFATLPSARTPATSHFSKRGVPRRWLEGASELAERIDKSYASQDMTPIILHGRIAEALYAITILTYSDGWSASDRYRLWAGLGAYLGFGPGKDALRSDELGDEASERA